MCQAGLVLAVLVLYCVLLSLLVQDASNHERSGLGGRQLGARGARGTGPLSPSATGPHFPLGTGLKAPNQEPPPSTPPQPRRLAQEPDYAHDENLQYDFKSSSGILEKETMKSINEIDTERLKIENRGDDNDSSLVEGGEVAYYDDSSEDEEGSLDYDWHADNYKKYNNYVKHVLFSAIYKPRYVIENSKICKGNSKIFVFINSRVNNTNTRQVIRETYLKQFIRRKISYGFLISMPEGKLAMRSVEAENARFQDLVVVGSQELYPQLTLKTAHMLQWAATNCPHTTYVAKVDDDVYVNVRRFLKVLDAPRNRTILGKVCSSCVPFRGSHVALSQALRQFSNVVTRRHMPLTKFPPFAMGPAYVITLDVVPLLLEAAQEMVYFSYEDVFWTGLAAEMVSRESGVSIGVREDPDSIKVKYQEMAGDRLPSTQVRHEDVPGWRADRRSQQPLRIALNKARNAVTVHNINWVTDEQFVSSLQNI